MKALALSLASTGISSEVDYYEHLKGLIEANRPDLALLPAYTSLVFARSCNLLPSGVHSFSQAIKALSDHNDRFQDAYFFLHRRLAEKCKCYLVPGTYFDTSGEGSLYHSAALLNPEGRVLDTQRQTHLSLQDKSLGFSRGSELTLFQTPLGKLGIVIGTDSWYPEVSRILALKGAEVICHTGALPSWMGPWHQLSGMWKEVQQNQFFCLESQLSARLWDKSFAGRLAIHAPCEMTVGKTGYLARGKAEQELLIADLDWEKRREVINSYPLLGMLNGEAYPSYLPGIYRSGQEQE